MAKKKIGRGLKRHKDALKQAGGTPRLRWWGYDGETARGGEQYSG